MGRLGFLITTGVGLIVFLLASGGVHVSSPDGVDASNGYAIGGVVWDDTLDINGQQDIGEVAPSADVDLNLCQLGADDCEAEFSTPMEADGSYQFADLAAGDYELCLEVTPPTDWTLTMVLLNGSGVSPSEVVVRCLGLQVGEGDTTVDFGIAHVASEFSFTKECDTDSLQAQEINCTLTVTNVGETVLFSRDVWDFYNCDGLEFVSADPTSGDTWEEDGECGVDWEPEYWDADELYPGQSEQYHMTFVPADGADEAFNCVGGGAWNVRILLDGDDYYAWSEDVRVDEGACVDFAAPPSATPTPTPAATATPTPTPEAAPAAELPETGGEPADGSSGLPWLAAIAGAIAVMSVGGFWFAYQRRHVR